MDEIGLSTILSNPLAAGIAGGVVGAGVGALTTAALLGGTGNSSKSSRSRHSKIKHTSRGWAQDRKKRSKQKWELAYQRRKKKSRRGVHYTKKGQPYVLLASGKAKFIKRTKGRAKK